MPLPRIAEIDELTELRPDHELVDLHFHTRWSDGTATVRQALDRANELGIRVAITDHNVIEGALEAWELAGDEAPRRVIPGIEVTTLERIHLLVYFQNPYSLLDFYARHIVPNRPRGFTATSVIPLTAESLLDRLDGYEHMSSAAHPFAAAKNGWLNARARYDYLHGLIDQLDAIEVLNGEELSGGNEKAAELARRTQHAVTAGSDGHTLKELGQVGLALPRGADLFEALRAREATLFDLRNRGSLRTLAAHSAKAPYFAARPLRFAWRYLSDQAGDGPLTMAGSLSELE